MAAAAPPRLLSALPALVVEDIPAAVAFYRDVLRFRVPAEYEGAGEFASVDLAPGQGVQLKRGTPARAGRRQMGVYVHLGFEALERLAEHVAARGGNVVSPLAERPWGMREMAVLDDSGYLVRLGAQSGGAHSDEPPRIWPDVPVTDVAAAAAFCRDVLGMAPAATNDDSPYFRRTHRDEVILHWWAASPSPFAAVLLAPRNRVRAGIWDVYVEVRGLEALAADLAVRGAQVLRGPVMTGYGVRELEIAGPDGCAICFGETP